MAIFVSKHIIQTASENTSSSLANGITVDMPATAAAAREAAGQRADEAVSQPPITNRGAEITAPTENRSLLDWVAFTLKADDPHEALKVTGLSPSLFTEFQYGFSGYRKSLRFGDISVFYQGRKGMGCHINMSGQGCRQFEAQFPENPWSELFSTALAASVNFTRLDLAIDNVDGALSLEKLCEALQDHERQVRTRFGEWRRILKGSFHQGEQLTGETIYLGSSKSHLMCRVYNKAQETGLDGQWIRFEIQLREKRAHEAARLFDALPVGPLAVGIINNYFAVINNDDSNISRCTLQPWWSAWLQSTEKITLTTEKAIKFVSDSMDFIKRQYAPSLAMINKHLGDASFNEFFQEVLEDGRERMGAKHELILAASAGTVQEGGKP